MAPLSEKTAPLASDRAATHHFWAPTVSWPAFLLSFAIVLAIFLVVDNPLQGDPFDIERSILWSYIPIPLLLAFFLHREKKLQWSTLLFDSMMLGFGKFAVTISIAVVLWTTVGRQPEAAAAVSATPVESDAVVQFEDVDDVGTLPVVSPASGDTPAEITLSVSDPVVLKPTGVLHTAYATSADGELLFNHPILPNTMQTMRFNKPVGRVTIRCTVHKNERFPDINVVAQR